MEKSNKIGPVCDCSNCQMHGPYHRFFWLRWFLALLILGMVFGVGIKVGEFKEFFDSSLSRPGYMDHQHMDYDRYPVVTPAPTNSVQTPTSTNSKAK